jgi:hypothetical protein
MVVVKPVWMRVIVVRQVIACIARFSSLEYHLAQCGASDRT